MRARARQVGRHREQGAAGRAPPASWRRPPRSARVDLYFEAAVAGAIPVIRPLTQSLAGDTVLRVAGIVNGTTNYILSAMDEHRRRATTRRWPRPARWATPRPTRPPTSRATTPRPRPRSWRPSPSTPGSTADDVYREGITEGHRRPTSSRRRRWVAPSSCWRSASASPTDDGQQRVSARVYPALVPLSHPLATVNGAFNAVVVEAEAAGRLMFYGQGAGGAPTASAVIGDLVMAAPQPGAGRPRARGSRSMPSCRSRPMGVMPTRYYVSLNVDDKPGVLSSVAAEFAKREVSIAEVRQEGVVDEGGRGWAPASWCVTHSATDAALSETVDALADLDVGASVASVLRMEGTSA